MRSLRSRLFFVMLGTFVVIWAITLACLGVQMSRERTGLRDRALGDIGRQILLSMPSDVRLLSGATNLRHAESMPTSGKFGTLLFQVWIKARHEVVVHRLPEWLEWTLAVFLGYLVMELVRYVIRSNRHLLHIDWPAGDKSRDDGEQPNTSG